MKVIRVERDSVIISKNRKRNRVSTCLKISSYKNLNYVNSEKAIDQMKTFFVATANKNL